MAVTTQQLQEVPLVLHHRAGICELVTLQLTVSIHVYSTFNANDVANFLEDGLYSESPEDMWNDY